MKKLLSSVRLMLPKSTSTLALIACFILTGRVQTNAQQCSLVCNDLVQVAVPANGTTEFLPDYMLEGDYTINCPGGIFQSQVQFGTNWLPASDNFVFEPIHIGQTFVARIKELNTGNICWGNVQVIEGNPAGINDIPGGRQAGILEISPNPASQFIRLQIASEAQNMALRIADIQGRSVLQQNLTNGGKVDVSGLANGVYSVIATTPSGQVFSNKFRKQR